MERSYCNFFIKLLFYTSSKTVKTQNNCNLTIASIPTDSQFQIHSLKFTSRPDLVIDGASVAFCGETYQRRFFCYRLRCLISEEMSHQDLLFRLIFLDPEPAEYPLLKEVCRSLFEHFIIGQKVKPISSYRSFVGSNNI